MSNRIEAGNNVTVGLAGYATAEGTCGNASNVGLSGYQTAQSQPCPTCGRCPTCGQYRYWYPLYQYPLCQYQLYQYPISQCNSPIQYQNAQTIN